MKGRPRERKIDGERELRRKCSTLKSGLGERSDNPSFCQTNYARIAVFFFTTPNLSAAK